jgi:hypothetical protein
MTGARARGTADSKASAFTPKSSSGWLGDESHGAHEVEHARIAGVLDGDAVAGPEVRLQHALHAVHRASDDGQGRGRDVVQLELACGPRGAARAGMSARRRVRKAGRTSQRAARRSSSQAGSGLPCARSRAPVVTTRGRRRRRGGRSTTRVPRRPSPTTSPRYARVR